MPNTPVILCILDGWGIAPDAPDNAITQANTPNWDALQQQFPMSQLATSGADVGLPDGQMGNSEVGHMNIGSGRIMMQDLPRIDAAITSGSLKAHPALQESIATLKASGNSVHIMGLFSPGGVHAHQDHIIALCNIYAEAGVPVKLHAFLDGRDTAPQSAITYLTDGLLQLHASVTLATLSGRYYSMDRDQRWDRIEKTYRSIIERSDISFSDPLDYIRDNYTKDITDEFILPASAQGYTGMQAGDAMLFANFRADRARELVTALALPHFDGFTRSNGAPFTQAIGITSYGDAIDPHLTTLFPPETPQETLGEIVANAGMTQLRISETEKYAHITFFFNGGRETPFNGEQRTLIPSPNVATYDLQPEMSAAAVTDALTHSIQHDGHSLIVVNYANTDMVGHTGNQAAAVKAIEAVDGCLGRLWAATQAAGGTLIVTADHGNAEKMFNDQTGQPHTAHTTYPVPCLIASEGMENTTLNNGRLCDLAPTILYLLSLNQPTVMSGQCLVR